MLETILTNVIKVIWIIILCLLISTIIIFIPSIIVYLVFSYFGWYCGWKIYCITLGVIILCINIFTIYRSYK